MPYTKINTRSPFFVSQAAAVGETVTVNLFLWNDPASEPASSTKVLSKKIPSASLLTVNFDISPFINQYISHSVFTPVSTLTATDVSTYAYCRVKVTKSSSAVVLQDLNLIAYKGYGYFEDGKNPAGQANVMLDEGEYYMLKNQNKGGLYYHEDAAGDWTATYTCLDGTTADVNLDLNIANGYIPYITTTHLNQGGSIVTILKDSVLQKTFTFREICEPKYTPLICDFVNRYGVWQTIVFFKVSKSKMTSTETVFNMMPASVDYSVSNNIRQTFNTNGQESIIVNTGWVLEHYSEVIKQLLLSNTIRLDNKPVVLNTKSVSLFTSINEKNINYTIEFNYANNIINTIQ
tara:strand:- start:5662 stop:6705 length:1044 start_codon:yes stop_codon:yes gene_type:complete